MAIDERTAESIIVSYGTEDFYGPYEILWGLNSLCPDDDDATKLEAARRALRKLLRKGLVQVHACRSGRPYSAPIVIDDAVAALETVNFWVTPAERGEPPFYWLDCTTLGEEALGRGEYDSL